MFYEIGKESRTVIDVDGFKLMKVVVRYAAYVSLSIETIPRYETDIVEEIDRVVVIDESDVEMALETINQSIYEWLENNVDEQDKVFARLTRGDQYASRSGYINTTGHSRY